MNIKKRKSTARVQRHHKKKYTKHKQNYSTNEEISVEKYLQGR